MVAATRMAEVEFVSRLIGDGAIEYEVFARYHYELTTEHGINEHSVEAGCGASRGIRGLLSKRRTRRCKGDRV